ncbi:tetratricopeptide repeat protein [Pelagibius sp. Alg239-R121]|uniref:tetratricopeptide repeat protein n=1 Tax=Pelagibius sp. Alg239-R121 TaxID=2993448 RepID=UPI0024A6E784|nr:tetratricopeptide repeat protein [Pelagibius sp. Alg239-R121]
MISAAGLRPQTLLAQTSTFEDGLAAYKAGRNQEAERIWRPLADAGDALAQYSLGKLFETGGGGTPDYEAAARWYALASQQDMAAAQNNLGLMYAQGRGVPRDPARAAQLWSRSANASNPMAQYNLGLAYFRGEGVGQDQVEAAVWFHLAADAGVGEAQFALGQMHRLGLALPQDDRRALHWYERAAKKGHDDAKVQAKRLTSQGVQPAQPIDVFPPDPLEQPTAKKPESEGVATAPAGKTEIPADQSTSKNEPVDARKPNLLSGNGAGAAQGDGQAPELAEPQLAGTAKAGSTNGGYQLQSRLIRPDPEPGNSQNRDKAQAQGNALTQGTGPDQKPAVQTARAAPVAQATPTGTLLWLLSSRNEAQARDLLKEAETDYASALSGQELTLLRDGQAGGKPFIRLVVKTASTAQADETCVRIREINSQAFCSILVR